MERSGHAGAVSFMIFALHSDGSAPVYKLILIILVSILQFSPNLTAAEEAAEAKWDVNTLPGDARTVPIDTNTGTWMSLDVSPDGETIAFDLLGDIYLLPMTGGEARAINSGLAWSIQPRFSPDGSEIAFISDAGGGDNIWIMNTDGSTPRQLTKEDFRLLNNPYWSPDGQYIAARKHFTTTRSLGTGEIWLYHRDGGSGVGQFAVERLLAGAAGEDEELGVWHGRH